MAPPTRAAVNGLTDGEKNARVDIFCPPFSKQMMMANHEFCLCVCLWLLCVLGCVVGQWGFRQGDLKWSVCNYDDGDRCRAPVKLLALLNLLILYTYPGVLHTECKV